MFLAQIHSIEDQIANLEEQMRVAQQQLRQYQNLREKAEGAIALIKEIQHQAANIGEVHHWQNAVMHALEMDDPQPPQPPTTHADTEAQEPQAEIEERSSEDSQVFPESIVDSYSLNPAALAAELEEDDPETILMRIANDLDTAPSVEIEGRVRFFVQNLPMELCDRTIGYLPKSIIPEWKKQVGSRKQALEMASAPTHQEVTEEEARSSIFPTEAPTEYEYQPERDDIVECKTNGLVGRIVHLNDSPNGLMASVLLPGGTSNFHISNLKYIGKYQEEVATPTEPMQEDTDPEIDQLAKQCLGLRSWSQIRIFADSNPEVISKMYEIATTKTEKRIINNLPSLIVGYIGRAGDRSDLEWLPDQLLSEVEMLIQQAA